MKFYNFFESKDVEINTKYFALYLTTMFASDNKNDDRKTASINQLIEATGLSKGQIYRAQSNLKKIGVLMMHGIHCQETGKKLSDIYYFKWD